MLHRKIPAEARSRATVAAMIEAAACVLEERGIEGYNTNIVAARAGISIGTLYQYFADKDAILAALVARERDAVNAVAAQAQASLSRHDGITLLVNAVVRQRLARPALARLLDVEAGRLRDRVPASGMPALGAVLAEQLLRPGARILPDAALTADDLLALVAGLVDGAAARGERDWAPLARRARAAVFGFLDRVDRGA